MRWEGLRTSEDDSAARATPPLPLALPGAVARTFDTPAFAGMTFYEIRAKSIINRIPARSRMMFDWTINPYRGCGHACTYCLAGDTPILMADGRTKPIADLRVGDRIYGTMRVGSYRRYTTTEILAHWSTTKPAWRVVLADGTELVASGDHRFLTDRGWKHVTGAQQGIARRAHLTTGNKLIGTGRFADPPQRNPEYLDGYRCGNGEAEPHASGTVEWFKGFLAGVYDAKGRRNAGILRIGSGDPELVERIRQALRSLGFRYAVDGTPGGLRFVRVLGGLREHLRFFHTVDPTITRKRTIDGMALKSDAPLGVVSVEPLGLDVPMFDVTTGTGDFIANGVVSHNCFARNTHTYLDLDSGRDFDTRIVVKVNAGELLRRELAAPKWRGEHIAMGTNVDCYQRAEGRYRLMREILAALRDFANPYSILTKGTLITRDIDLLKQGTDVGLAMSIGFVDETLWRSVEPGTPSPRRRLDAVRQLSDAGFAVSVLMAPILPGLTDTDESIDATAGAIAAAGAASVTPIVLHLRPGAREWYLTWLAREHRSLLPLYRERYGGKAYLDGAYQREVTARVRRAARRHGLRGSPTNEARPARPEPDQQLALPL